MFFGYVDPFYSWIFFITLAISFLAQIYIKVAFSRWSKEKNSADLTGEEIAFTLFKKTDLKPVKIEHASGTLSDHYDPVHQVVRLSNSTQKSNSVAAMAVVAHELGHVQQHQVGSALIKVRSFLVPAVTLSPVLSYAMIMVGLLLNIYGLARLGVLTFSLMVIFSFITLPIEIDASRRGTALLRQAGLLKTKSDKEGSRAVLTAAASTYLAAAVTALLQLLYYINLVNRDR